MLRSLVGSEMCIRDRFANSQAILASDTYTFHIDCNNKVEETCEENNLVETSLFMVGIEENIGNPSELGFVNFPKIYPNPAADQFQLAVYSKLPQTIQLACYHINGALMMQQNANLQTGANQFSFDVQNWQHGTYVVKMTVNNKHLLNKLVIK